MIKTGTKREKKDTVQIKWEEIIVEEYFSNY